MKKKSKTPKLIPLIRWTELEREWLKENAEITSDIPEEEVEYYESQVSLLIEGNIRELVRRTKARFFCNRHIFGMLNAVTKIEKATVEIKPISENTEEEILKAEFREKELSELITFEVIETIKEISKKENADIYSIKKTFEDFNLVKIQGDLRENFRKIEDTIRQHIGSVRDKKIYDWLERKLYYEVEELKDILKNPKVNSIYWVISPVYIYFKSPMEIFNLSRLVTLWLKHQLGEGIISFSHYTNNDEPIITVTHINKIPIKTLHFDAILYQVEKETLEKRRQDKEISLKARESVKSHKPKESKNLYYLESLSPSPVPPLNIELKSGEEIILQKGLVIGVLEDGETASVEDLRYLIAILHICKLYVREIRKELKRKLENEYSLAKLLNFLKENHIIIDLNKVAELLGSKPREDLYNAILNALMRFQNTKVVNGKIKIGRDKKRINEKNIESEAFIYKIKRKRNVIELRLSDFLLEGLVNDFFHAYNREIIISMKKYIFLFFTHLLSYIKNALKYKKFDKPIFILNETLEEWLGIKLYPNISRREIRKRVKKELKEASEKGIKVKTKNGEYWVKLFEINSNVKGTQGKEGIEIWLSREGIEKLFSLSSDDPKEMTITNAK